MLWRDVRAAGPASARTITRQATAARVQPPTQARVLELQRSAGNRAVTQLLQPQRPAPVQRAIGTRAGDLVPYMSSLTGTYAKMIWALRDFHRSKNDVDKITYANAIRGLARTWLDSHARPRTARDRTRFEKVIQLEAEASREHGVLLAQAQYLKDLESGGFQAAGGITRMHAVNPAKELRAGRTDTKTYKGADERAAELVAKYKLSAAEIAAIRTFTLPDYAYINPATANSESWLQSNILGAKDPKLQQQYGPVASTAGDPWAGSGLKRLMAEGAAHAGMLMQALSKLDPYTETTFRGERLTINEYVKKYRKGAELPFHAFSSAAKERSVAEGYADGTAGDIKPAADKTVSVLVEVKMTNGRDISTLSAAMLPEEEVLILPGSKFKVDGISKRTGAPPGQPPAKYWFVVHLTQTK